MRGPAVSSWFKIEICGRKLQKFLQPPVADFAPFLVSIPVKTSLWRINPRFPALPLPFQVLVLKKICCVGRHLCVLVACYRSKPPAPGSVSVQRFSLYSIFMWLSTANLWDGLSDTTQFDL